MENLKALKITNGKCWIEKMPLAVGTTKGKAKTFEQIKYSTRRKVWQHFMKLQATT